MNIEKLKEIKTALSKILEIEKVEMRSLTDEQGNILSWTNDTPLPEVDDEVYVEGRESEEKVLADAGEYITKNEIGETVKITVGEKGIVTAVEVVDPETETEPEEPEAEEPEVVAEEEVKAEEDEPKEEEIVVVEEVIDPDQTDEQNMEDLIKELADVRAENEELKAKVEELEAKIKELEEQPATEPATEQFEAMTKTKSKVSGAVKYAAALKKK